MSQQPDNRHVIAITGGSKGFGFAIANKLIEAGYRAGLIGRDARALQQAVESLGKQHCFAATADVGSSQQINEALQAIKKHFGQLNGLINNAGLARPNSVEKLKAEEVILQVNTNFLGTVFASQAAIPLLRGSDNPRIINISSASAWHYDEMSHLSIYAATKAAVERFSRDLREELQVDGIGVTCLRPGGAWTNFSDGWDSEALIAGLTAWQDAGAHMDSGMEVNDVANAVVYALAQPVGVAVDLLEIRPNILTHKVGG